MHVCSKNSRRRECLSGIMFALVLEQGPGIRILVKHYYSSTRVWAFSFMISRFRNQMAVEVLQHHKEPFFFLFFTFHQQRTRNYVGFHRMTGSIQRIRLGIYCNPISKVHLSHSASIVLQIDMDMDGEEREIDRYRKNRNNQTLRQDVEVASSCKANRIFLICPSRGLEDRSPSMFFLPLIQRRKFWTSYK